jgi:hypothetical protein
MDFVSFHEGLQIGVDAFGLLFGNDLGPDALLAKAIEGVLDALMRRSVLPIGDVVDGVGAHVEQAGQDFGGHAFKRKRVDREFFRAVKLSVARIALGVSEGFSVKFNHCAYLLDQPI